MIKMPFFTSEQPKRYKWSCQKMCGAPHYLLDNIFIRFGSELYRKIEGIPMGTNWAPLFADLFLICYERDLMLSLTDNNQTDIIETLNSTSRYLDDLLNIDTPYFKQMVGQIYPAELQLNKANSSDSKAPFLDLYLSITNGIISSKINDKRDDFNFEIVNFPFLDGDVPRSPSYGVYISQLIRFARVCSNVDDFINRNLFLTAKLLKQFYRYHIIRKAFSKFYHRHSELIVKYNIGLKTLLQQGISESIDFCKETGLRIINGRVGKDKGIGKCTYVGSAGKSVVDYVIASQCLFSAIDTFEVSDPNILSDHCMVKFSVISHDSISNDDCMNNFGSFCNFKYVWKDNEVDSYQNALQSNNVQGVLNDLKSNISNLTTVDELNQNVKSFQEIIEEVCNPLFKKDISKPRVQNCPIVDESNQPWFNGNCKQKREVFFRTLDVYRLNKDDNDYRVNMEGL